MMWFVRTLVFASLLCALAASCFSLDREAFAFTNYDLTLRVEPEQHRLGARGRITLRNDSSTPQKIAVLQISSSLDWRSIKIDGKPAQFVTQTFTSDIDHTGALSEALVTVPDAVAPKATIDLDIAYEGVIVLDATRLIRIGTPEANARNADWDQIGANFTAVRGVGYVAWYPIATEAVDLADRTNSLDPLGRWKTRQASSTMHVKIEVPRDDGGNPWALLVNQPSCAILYETLGRPQRNVADCTYKPLGLVVPTFALGNYDYADSPAVAISFFKGHDAAAVAYVDAGKKVTPQISDWFGAPNAKPFIVDLPDANYSPFESGSLLLIPLTGSDAKSTGLAITHLMAHAAFSSPRPWIDEGLAHFAQALYLEQDSGRQAAIGHMGLHRSAFVATQANKNITSQPSTVDETTNSLINTPDEQQYRSKSMYVWWMLRDVVGDQALKKALASYHPDQDREPSYMPALIQAQTQRDLEWFFDDWVYRDRGLPDFKIESVFARKTLPSGYLLTITVANAGAAGAEVPVTVKSAGGEIAKRLEVRGKSKAVIRMEVSSLPAEVTINDGSVPESDATNNSFKVEAEAK